MFRHRIARMLFVGERVLLLRYNRDEGDTKWPVAFDSNVCSEERMSWVSEMPLPALAVDERGMVKAASRRLLEVLHLNREQVVGNPLEAFLVLPPKVQAAIRQLEMYPCPSPVEGVLRPFGSDPVTVDVQWMRDGDSGSWSLLLTVPGEESRDRVRKYADRIVARSSRGVVILRESTVAGMNPAACGLLGLDREEVYGKHATDLFVRMEESEGLQEVRNRVAQGQTFRGLSISRKQGRRPVIIHVDGEVLEDSSDLLLTLTDMTQVYLLEMQVRETDRLAMIGQLAAGTAHEIRNPLTSIRGFLQVMRHTLNERGDMKSQGYAEIMLREIDRINDLLGEFLMMSKPSGLKKKLIQLDQVIRELLPIIENEGLLHNIEVRFLLQEIPCPLIEADGELLKQVILNLCKNGIEAMGEGGVLTIRLSGLSESGFLSLEVEDQGPGIHPRAKEKIFDPFYTTKENGTGLGLPVCKRIIQDLRGEIRVLSGERGAIFQVLIPYHKV